jgi:hypothetical protein
MYKVTCNDKILHNDESQGLRISNGKLTLELGKSGLFEFTIYPTHPYYDTVFPMLSIVEVFREELSIFRGRVLNIKYGFHNEKQVTCEGELAFLLDSIIGPHFVSGSFSEYFDYIIDIHNAQVEEAKRFTRGSVTVADFLPFEVLEDYYFLTSYETLNKRMVEPSGGYLQARHEYGTMYLDLLSPDMDISNVSGQKIRLGKNLIDIKKDVEGSEVFSGIVPLGAKIGDTENRLDISSVNGGSYSIVNNAAVAAYGKIFKTVIFENITNASTLLQEARAYLAENYAAINTIEITALDLSGANPDLDSFKVGQWVVVESEPHFGQSQTFLIRKMTISLSNPADTKIEVGRTKQGLTDSIGNVTNNLGAIMSSIGSVSGNLSSISAKADIATTKATEAVTKATEATTKANSATTVANNAVTAVNNVSSRVSTLEVKPYITATGTTGIWKWKKFSDNTCEFFGKIPVTNYEITIALGGWYRGANLYDTTTYAYPFAMTEAPAVEMTFQTRNGLAAIAWVFSANADIAQSYLPQCYLIRPVTGTGIYGNINVIGKGKLS